MPYELKFSKVIAVENQNIYFNECCIGGDKIADHILPMIRDNYSDIQDDQEDWGWFIWFKGGKSKLAIDIFCDDPDEGKYRIFLTSQVKPSFFGYRIIDSDDLILLKSRTKGVLTDWVDSEIEVSLLDKNHEPIATAASNPP
jgi:hypothetical protein